MKSADFEPANFASTGNGIQQALDYCGGAIGSAVYVGPGDYTITNLTMHGKTSLLGYGALVTRLNCSAGMIGVALREKTAGEGNISGATGITVQGVGIYGVATAAGGIDFGNQGGASFNANAQLCDVLVRDFTGGYGYKLLANAIHCRNFWAANCSTGMWLSGAGGACHFDGLWSEQCSATHLRVETPWNTFQHVQIEQSGGVPSGPLIDLAVSAADRNVFAGVYMSLANNLTNLIIARTGVIGSQFYGVRVVPNGHSYTNTIYTEGTATGTGAQDWIGFFNDMSSSGKHYMNDQSLAEQTIFTGARPTFPQATVGTLAITGNTTMTGTVTQGAAGVGSSATFGQGATGTDSSTVRVQSGSGAGAIAQMLLRQNATDLAGLRYASGDTYLDYGGTLRLRSGLSGTERANLTAAGALTLGALTSGKYPKISTGGLIIDGPTPLAGTKVYYVSDTSGGAVNRKLTFTDGILTAET